MIPRRGLRSFLARPREATGARYAPAYRCPVWRGFVWRGLAWCWPLALAWAGPAAAADEYPLTFRETTREAGLLEPLAGLMGHGAAWGDFNNDGHPDLYVGGFADRPAAEYEPAPGAPRNVLLKNDGHVAFVPVPDTPAAYRARTSGALFADLDNDGWVELLVANNARVKSGVPPADDRARAAAQLTSLFHNRAGEFVESTEASGAVPPALLSARNVAAFDATGDGRLDLFFIEDRFTKQPGCVLLENLGQLKFREITGKAGLPDNLFGLGHAVGDVNEDGRPDLFVGHSNRFFLSTAQGTFREDASLNATFAWQPLDAEDWPCGAALADLNRDGRLDLVLAIHGQRARNRIYLNQGLSEGTPRFRDITREAGLPDAVPQKCPHVEVEDFDNDGWPDLYFSAGWLEGETLVPLVFRHAGLHQGVPRFTPPREVPAQAPPNLVYFPAGPTADYDGDGRIDLFLVNWFRGNRCRLLKNESPERQWLRVMVGGTSFNRQGIGSRVSVYRAGGLGQAEKLLGLREIHIGQGYASGQLASAHFGLGGETEVDVRVRTPAGHTIDRPGVRAGQVLHIAEE